MPLHMFTCLYMYVYVLYTGVRIQVVAAVPPDRVGHTYIGHNDIGYGSSAAG